MHWYLGSAHIQCTQHVEGCLSCIGTDREVFECSAEFINWKFKSTSKATSYTNLIEVSKVIIEHLYILFLVGRCPQYAF